MAFIERGIKHELFGVVSSQPELGLVPRVIIRTEHTSMAKADKNGTYTLTNDAGEVLNFFIAAGDEIPENAKYTPGDAYLKSVVGEGGTNTDEQSSERSRSAAPENKAK
jgi:hypothetical protein